MRKKLLLKPFSIVWKNQTVAQIIIDKVMVPIIETIADIQEEYDQLVLKIPNRETIFLLNENSTILSAISLSYLSSDQSYGRLHDGEPINQLFNQTILPLSKNATSTAEVFISKKIQFLMGSG